MEQTLKWHSPRSPTGSVLSAVLVHSLLYAAVVVALGLGLSNKHEAPSVEAEVTYEMLNEAPTETKVVKQVVKANPETPVEKNLKPDLTPKELQDDKSTVAGTQTAAKPQSNVGSDQNGTAASTPFYKVKPKYPKAALIAGTEGWIMLKVDVSEAGTVENVRVVDGEQRNLFQDDARRAVEKWKYHPFVDEGGKPYRKKDHQVRVDFKLNEV